jgi:hypothetical protein
MTHGLICDGCNNYSAQLEAVLVSHPAIAMPIQLLGLKGKKGKPRTKLGEFVRGAEDGATITFATTEPIITVDPDGVRRATIKSLPDPRFDMAKFSRALHLAAFNVAALNRGAEWALDPARDAVRAYVRKPRLGERWTFVKITADSDVRSLIQVTPVEMEGVDILRLSIFSLDYFVDLANSGRLETVRITPAEAGSIVGRDWKPSKPEKSKPGVYYRASIY